MGHLSFHLDVREPVRRHLAVRLTVDLDLLDRVEASGQSGIEFLFAAWTPGSYLIREYCRHVSDFGVTDGEGRVVAWCKTSKNRYRVTPDAATRRLDISYTVYCHELSVRTSDLTDQHAFLVGAELFLWPLVPPGGPGDPRPASPADLSVELRVQVPPSWRLETSLPTERTAPGEFALRSTGLHDLIDSPILAGELDVRTFTALGKPHAFVLDGLAGVLVPETMIDDTIAIIEHAAAVFGGELPYEEYKFLCMFSDTGRGGLEHSSSTALLAPRTTFRPPRRYREFMGLVAHEFFHVWNVKRMRPAELWDVDYERENYTELLWVAEGFTAYYDDHLCRRAGLMTAEQYLKILADGITDLRRTPGRQHQTLAEASYDAWIRLYRPDENTRNSTLSYYGNGALAALCLDLRIRSATAGHRCLDDVMRRLFEDTYLAGTGYTEATLVECVNQVAGIDLSETIDSLVHQALDPDFAEIFNLVGLELVGLERHDQSSSQPYLGVHFKSGSTVLASVIEDSPADRGCLMPGDELLAIDGLRVKSGHWSRVFDHLAKTDEELQVLFARRGRIATASITPTPRPQGGLELAPRKDCTPAQERLRRSWLYV